jgi:hypothetical protein
MNIFTFKTAGYYLLVICGLIIPILSSCDKTADPSVIKVSSTAIPGITPANPGTGTTTPGTGTTTPGTGTTTPGTGTTTPGTGTTTPGTGTTTPGTGTTTPGTGTTTPGTGTTTPGTGTTTPGTGTTTPGTGTTTPGTANTNGDGGVAIGNVGTITFTFRGKTYNLINNGTTYFTLASYLKESGSSPFETTSIIGSSSTPLSPDITFTMLVQTSKPGIHDVPLISLFMGDGTAYSSTSTPGRVNLQTLTITGNKAVTKGTFDAYLLNPDDDKAPFRISGSFNIQ